MTLHITVYQGKTIRSIRRIIFLLLFLKKIHRILPLKHFIYTVTSYECLASSFEVGCHCIYIVTCYTECLTSYFEVGCHFIYNATSYTECPTRSFEVGCTVFILPHVIPSVSLVTVKSAKSLHSYCHKLYRASY